MTNDRIFVTRPNGQVQSEDRIYLLFPGRPNGVNILSRAPEIQAAPKNGVAATDRPFFRILVGLWGGGDDRYTQFVNTVAAELCRVLVAINTVGVDIDAVPIKDLALR